MISPQAQPAVVQVTTTTRGPTAGALTIRSAAFTLLSSWTDHLTAQASTVAAPSYSASHTAMATAATSGAERASTAVLLAMWETSFGMSAPGVVAALALTEQHTSPGKSSSLSSECSNRA